MEKKVNITIFFNYRSYSPRFKMLLEDVFYKRMHDNKLSSSDAMQEVMKFCNDVDEIDYSEFESEILSRYSISERKIMINSTAVNKLSDEHRDLDEEALLKNILQKQVQNVLEENEVKEVYDITFEDVLNRSGYIAPRKLSDVVKEENTNLTDESVINEIVTPKIAKKSEIKPSDDIKLTDEDKRFVSQEQTMQIASIQNELKEKLQNSQNNKVSFENFFPEDKNNEQENMFYQKVGILSKRFNVEEPEDNFNLLDCIKRKDEGTSNFSDFVPDKKDYDYEFEDDYTDNKKSKKSKTKLFSDVKEKMMAFTDKIKNSLSKKEDDDDYSELFSKEIDNVDLVESNDDDYSIDNNSSEDLDLVKRYNDAINYEEENVSTASIKEEKFDFESSDNEIDFDDKFDNIISAIMKEKQKELEEDELLSSYDEFEEYSNNVETEMVESIYEDKSLSEQQQEDKDYMTSVYDAFAEELETVESVKKRRRNR